MNSFAIFAYVAFRNSVFDRSAVHMVLLLIQCLVKHIILKPPFTLSTKPTYASMFALINFFGSVLSSPKHLCQYLVLVHYIQLQCQSFSRNLHDLEIYELPRPDFIISGTPYRLSQFSIKFVTCFVLVELRIGIAGHLFFLFGAKKRNPFH